MTDQLNRFLDKFRKDDQQNYGGLFNNLRLIVRLLKDRRVNFLLKLLPVGALLYLVVPIDFLPLNPLDDAAVLWLGGTLFVGLCPNNVVQEHRQALQKSIRGVDIVEKKASDVVDAELKDIPPSKE
ncbi:MAG: hypothetical protein SVP52_08915 [Chloroflexota bacterium]|nr:hypothetical protein [Chloroflexota bacterium]